MLINRIGSTTVGWSSVSFNASSEAIEGGVLEDKQRCVSIAGAVGNTTLRSSLSGYTVTAESGDGVADSAVMAGVLACIDVAISSIRDCTSSTEVMLPDTKSRHSKNILPFWVR